MQVETSVGAPSYGEHVGAFAVAVDPTGGEKSPVRAIVAVVSAGNCADMWGPSVSGGLFENGKFSFSEMDE